MTAPTHTKHIESSVELSPDVVALLERIPRFPDATSLSVEPLRDVISLNNANYRVNCGADAYVLRVASEEGRHLGIRREEEIESARAAASIGVAPEVLYAEPTGHLLLPWIEGRHWQADDFHVPENIARLAETLRQLHSVKTVQGDGSVFRRIERLIESAGHLPVQMPPHLDDYLQTMNAFESKRHANSRFSPGLVHNDLWANNFLDDGNQLWLVDWEFSGNGDGFYDLATISMAGNYSQKEQFTLLTAYGDTSSDALESLEMMKWIVAFFEAMWALVMHGLRGSEGFDYHTHADKMFTRLSNTNPL